MATEHIGTVSHGTMRYVDLIPRFADYLVKQCGHKFSREDAQVIHYFQHAQWDSELDDELLNQGSFILEEMFDALDNYAPEGYYFGAHPGDGSDYGFWEVEE